MRFKNYQSVLQHLVSDKELLPLSRFKSTRNSMIYPDALAYPDFFTTNLVAPGRVIKVVKGPSALLRAFIYQLMKLTFEIQVAGVDYAQIFKKVVFHPELIAQQKLAQIGASTTRKHSDMQYKRILVDFIDMISQQSIPNFEFTLMEYPIVDEALTYIFQSLMEKVYQGNRRSTNDKLNWLSQTFEVNIQKHGRCYKFEESDIFLYEEGAEEYYLAFLNEMAEVSDISESTNRVSNEKGREVREIREDEFEHGYSQLYPEDRYRYSAKIGQQRPAIEQEPTYRRTADPKTFMDLVGGKHLDDSASKSEERSKEDPYNSKIGSLLDIMTERSAKSAKSAKSNKTPEPEPIEQFIRVEDQQSPEITHTPHFSQASGYVQEENYNPFTKKYSEQYMGDMYDRNLFQGTSNTDQRLIKSPIKTHPAPTRAVEPDQPIYATAPAPDTTQDEIFYNPRRAVVKAPVRTVQQSRAQPEESIGTLYRQFTDTRVLNVMTSMERNNVRNIRQRYKGMHRRDLGPY